MRRFLAIVPLALLAACGGTPAPDATSTPSVLVSLTQAKRGSAPDYVTAYGSATPATNGTQTLSAAQAGQVSRLAVTPGASVRAGQALVVFATDPSAVSAFQQATTALAAARKQRASTAQLLTQQLATRDQLVQAEKAVADAQASLAALRRQGAGQPVRTLTAPFDGTVTAVPVAQGDRTQPGAPLVTVARSGGIVATVGVDPADRARVRVGQVARIVRLSGGAAIAGHVIRVDSLLNAKTRLVDVDLAFPAGALLTNEALRGDIAVAEVAGWLVPHRAVVTANGPAHIFQIVGGKAHSVPVKLLLSGETTDVIAGALDPGARVIVDGAFQVEDGAAVRWAGR